MSNEHKIIAPYITRRHALRILYASLLTATLPTLTTCDYLDDYYELIKTMEPAESTKNVSSWIRFDPETGDGSLFYLFQPGIFAPKSGGGRNSHFGTILRFPHRVNTFFHPHHGMLSVKGHIITFPYIKARFNWDKDIGQYTRNQPQTFYIDWKNNETTSILWNDQSIPNRRV